MRGLVDRRLREISHKRAAVDEVLELEVLYKKTYGFEAQDRPINIRL